MDIGNNSYTVYNKLTPKTRGSRGDIQTSHTSTIFDKKCKLIDNKHVELLVANYMLNKMNFFGAINFEIEGSNIIFNLCSRCHVLHLISKDNKQILHRTLINSCRN